MKKTLKVIVALLLVFSLSFIVACGKDDNNNHSNPNGTDLPIIDWPG